MEDSRALEQCRTNFCKCLLLYFITSCRLLILIFSCHLYSDLNDKDLSGFVVNGIETDDAHDDTSSGTGSDSDAHEAMDLSSNGKNMFNQITKDYCV